MKQWCHSSELLSVLDGNPAINGPSTCRPSDGNVREGLRQNASGSLPQVANITRMMARGDAIGQGYQGKEVISLGPKTAVWRWYASRFELLSCPPHHHLSLVPKKTLLRSILAAWLPSRLHAELSRRIWGKEGTSALSNGQKKSTGRAAGTVDIKMGNPWPVDCSTLNLRTTYDTYKTWRLQLCLSWCNSL